MTEVCKHCRYSETCEKSPEHMEYCQSEEEYIKDMIENGSYYDDVDRFFLDEYDD